METAVTKYPPEFANFPNGPTWCEQSDDFIDERTLTAAVERWIGTALAGGSVTWFDGANGRLSLDASAGGDGYQIQADNEWVQLATSKQTDAMVRVYAPTGTGTQMWFAGLSITDTTALSTTQTIADGLTSSDAVGILAIGTTVYGVIRTGGVQTSVTLSSSNVRDIYETWSLRVEMSSTAASGVVRFYKNGTSVGSITSTGFTAELMAPTVAFESATDASSLYVDLACFRQER